MTTALSVLPYVATVPRLPGERCGEWRRFSAMMSTVLGTDGVMDPIESVAALLASAVRTVACLRSLRTV